MNERISEGENGMEYMNCNFFRPPEDYDIGIRGGPVLPNGIVNSPLINEPLEYRTGKYCLLYSPVTPTGQKLALTVALDGFLREIAVISTHDGRLLWELRDGSNVPVWREASKAETAAFGLAGHVRLPALVDLDNRQVVSNDPYLLPVKIIFDLAHAAGKESALTLLPDSPASLEWESRIFYDLHAAVYRAGFVSRQAEYEHEVERVYRFLEDLDRHLAGKSYLFSGRLTLPDLWLFTLLIRYDQVYAPGFRLHKYRIRDFPEIWRYLRRLYAIKECSFTTDFSAISRGYFLGIPALNRGIVPLGPDDCFL